MLEKFYRITVDGALGCFNPSETSDAYYILSNDRDEIWFICNRHLRTVFLDASNTAFRVKMQEPVESLPVLSAAVRCNAPTALCCLTPSSAALGSRAHRHVLIIQQGTSIEPTLAGRVGQGDDEFRMAAGPHLLGRFCA